MQEKEPHSTNETSIGIVTTSKIKDQGRTKISEANSLENSESFYDQNLQIAIS